MLEHDRRMYVVGLQLLFFCMGVTFSSMPPDVRNIHTQVALGVVPNLQHQGPRYSHEKTILYDTYRCGPELPNLLNPVKLSSSIPTPSIYICAGEGIGDARISQHNPTRQDWLP